jgi:oxygen-independent coproporphyrinogen III oxidase
MLEVDEDSRLGSEVLLNGKRYGAPEVPGDAAIAEMYETAVHELARMGIDRYEISNFARPGFESLHNLKYWRLEPYMGFGADAHSFDGQKRNQNVENAQEYVERVLAGRTACVASVPAMHDEERFFVGLRLAEGVRLQEDEQERFERPIRRFVNEGLLSLDGPNLRLTDRGVLFSNEVFAEFIGS